MRSVVPSGSGKAWHAIVRDLLERGHEVLNVDRVPSAESGKPDSSAPFPPADLKARPVLGYERTFSWRAIL